MTLGLRHIPRTGTQALVDTLPDGRSAEGNRWQQVVSLGARALDTTGIPIESLLNRAQNSSIQSHGRAAVLLQ